MTSNPRARDTARWAHHASRTGVVGLLVLAWSLACQPRHMPRCCRPSSKTRWRTFWPSSSCSSSRSAASWCSGSCTSCRRRSRTSAITRSSRPFARCACCRWSSAACCGRSRGCGPIPSRSATRWRTARTSIRTTTGTRRSTSARRSTDLQQRVGFLSKRGPTASDLESMRADLAALESRITASRAGGEDK